MSTSNQHIALIGFGHVGRALYKQLLELPGFTLEGVAVKHPEKHARHLPKHLLFESAEALIDLPKVETVMEAINDADAAFAYAKHALTQGKTVISASKKMLAAHLPLLHNIERQYGGKLLYEAAVGGAIPILRTLREHLRGEPISSVRGILNGTCNYILSRMHESDLSFDSALKEAQDLGFAESDPGSDIDGYDAYYKAMILAHTLHGGNAPFSRVVFEGIPGIHRSDVDKARKQGMKIKLVAEVKVLDEKYQIDIRPSVLSIDDPLYHVEREQNALAIHGAHSGVITLQGAGAGGVPTASAMRADLLNAPKGEIRRLRRLLLEVDS